MRPEEYASLAQALQAGREALERLEHPELQLRMTKYRSVAEQREFIGEPSDHELLLHFGIEETGSPGAVLNEATAKASPCSCFTYKGKDICWSRGIVGLLTQPQQGTYCVAGKAYKAQPALTKRYTTFAEAAEEAHKKIEAMPKGMPRLEVWLGEMGKALSKHGIEV